MTGEFFTVLFYKKILTSQFFVTFKSRKANDGDDDHGRRETEYGGLDNVGHDKVEEEDNGR